MKPSHTMAVRVADRLGPWLVEATLPTFPERVRQATLAWAVAHPQVVSATLVVSEVGTLQTARVKFSVNMGVPA